MANLDNWDIALICFAAFVAVATLVRLMLARRDALIDEVEEQLANAKAKRRKKRSSD